MAWDFSTEPEFEEQLDWMRTFVREEIWPLETIVSQLDQAAERRLAELAEDGLDRPDLLAHELAHPVQLRLELGLGREVPRHREVLPPRSAVRPG